MKSLIKISRGQIENVFKEYETIALLIADQANQSPNRLYKVIDASADPNLTFPVGETNKQAYYEYKENANEVIGDYTLISAPYAISFPKEEDIRGTAVEYIAEGGEPVDISQASHYNVNVFLNSIITLTGLPPVGKSYTRTVLAISETGAEDLSFANATNEFGSYDPTKVNFITIRVSNTTNTGLVVNVFYEQANEITE